jgi:PKD repeat protein
MKTITKKNKLKKISCIIALCFGLSSLANAQCNANYTYTVGSSGSVSFTNTSTITSGLPAYHWDFGDGSSSSATSPVHAFQYNGTYFVNLSVWDTSGTCFDSISQSISITNGLTCSIAAGFSYTAGSAGQINFTNTTANAPAGAVYSWGFGDGSSSGATSPTHAYYYNSSYTVYLYASDSGGHCTNATSQTVTVSNANTCSLSVNFTYTLGSSGQVAFTNISSGYDSTLTTPVWTFGDGNASNYSSPANHYIYNGTYTATLHIGDSTNVCYGNHSETIVITNSGTAPVCGAYFIDSIQNNGTVNFINQSWGTTANTSYSWNLGSGYTSNLPNPSVTYSVNGVYSVSLQITDVSTGCSSYYVDTVTVSNVTPPCAPTVSFYMYQDTANPQPGVWEVSTYYSSQVTSALWHWGDGTSTVGLYPTHTYTAAGHYNICVMVYSSCGDSAYFCQNDSLFRTESVIQVSVVNAATTGIKTNAVETAHVSIYPNPSAGLFTLGINNASINAGKAQISITDILGENVYSAQESINSGSISKSIDIQNMADGAYFMKVMVGDKAYIQKLIINK